MLAQQVQQGAFDGGHGMDGHAKVKGLLAASAAVAVGKALAHGAQHRVVATNRLAFDERTRVFQGLADLLAAGHLAHAGASAGVGQHHQVAGEKRTVRAAQVEQHAVMPGHRNDLHALNQGRGGKTHGKIKR